jgi:hypothetical protein
VVAAVSAARWLAAVFAASHGGSGGGSPHEEAPPVPLEAFLPGVVLRRSLFSAAAPHARRVVREPGTRHPLRALYWALQLDALRERSERRLVVSATGAERLAAPSERLASPSKRTWVRGYDGALRWVGLGEGNPSPLPHDRRGPMQEIVDHMLVDDR